MDLRNFGVIKIFTTPTELRNLADKMDEILKTIKSGDSTLVKEICEGKTCVQFVIDQRTWDKENKNKINKLVAEGLCPKCGKDLDYLGTELNPFNNVDNRKGRERWKCRNCGKSFARNI